MRRPDRLSPGPDGRRPALDHGAGRGGPALLQGGDPTAQIYLERFHHLLIALARLESLEEIAADSQPPESATVLVGSMKVLVPLGSIIERGTELKRLGREIKKLRIDLERSEKKLKNNSFIAKAPPDIVAKEQSRVESISHSITELEKQRQRVERL